MSYETPSLEEMTTSELRRAIARGLASIAQWGECDNQSDYMCCSACGVPYYRRELEARRSAEGASRALSNPALTVARARELGLI